MNTANFAWEEKNSLTFSPDATSIKNHIFEGTKKAMKNKKQGDNSQKQGDNSQKQGDNSQKGRNLRREKNQKHS